MTHYECTFIARQDLTPADVEKVVERLTAILEKHGGKVERKEYWGLRNLAYEINKQRKGHYTMLCVTAGNEAMDALRMELRISEDIIRNLEVRVDKFDNKPSIMMRSADDAAVA